MEHQEQLDFVASKRTKITDIIMSTGCHVSFWPDCGFTKADTIEATAGAGIDDLNHQGGQTTKLVTAMGIFRGTKPRIG